MQVETTEKDEALTAKMQEHANLQHEKDELEQQLLEIRKELDGAYHTIANQVNWCYIKTKSNIIFLFSSLIAKKLRVCQIYCVLLV